MIEKATLDACRAGGGIVAGLIMTPGRCKFDPRTIMCSAGDGPNCLTSGQVQALQKIFQGPTNSAGLKLYPGFLPGHEDDYPAFITGDETGDSQSARNADTLMRYFIYGPEFDATKQFDFDSSLAALVPLAGAQDAAKPDLSAFKAHGGKLIMYHGWADHSITPVRTIQYYAEVIDVMTKDRSDNSPGEENADSVSDFFRLFMVPGMHHCRQGPGPNSFGGPNQGIPQQLDAQHDIVMALDRWVEDGIAPEKIIASHSTNGVVDRSLPLCPYPQTPAFNGSGNMNTSDNYHCEQRGYWWAIESAEIGKRGSGAVSRSRPN
jgi:feruloyl esterase